MGDALIVCSRISEETATVGHLVNCFNKARPQGLVSAARTTTKRMFCDATLEKKWPLLKPYIAHENVRASRATAQIWWPCINFNFAVTFSGDTYSKKIGTTLRQWCMPPESPRKILSPQWNSWSQHWSLIAIANLWPSQITSKTMTKLWPKCLPPPPVTKPWPICITVTNLWPIPPPFGPVTNLWPMYFPLTATNSFISEL